MQCWLEPSEMQREYIKSRQGNLRCFPCCTEGSHRSRSFCGDSLKVRLEGFHAQEQCMMVGEIRRISSAHSLRLNEPVNVQSIKANPAYFLANYVRSTPQETRFSFNPNRRWKLSVTGKLKDDSLFCFTIFFIVNDVVQHVMDTSAFKITPIWRLDKEEEEDYGNASESSLSLGASPPIRTATMAASGLAPAAAATISDTAPQAVARMHGASFVAPQNQPSMPFVPFSYSPPPLNTSVMQSAFPTAPPMFASPRTDFFQHLMPSSHQTAPPAPPPPQPARFHFFPPTATMPYLPPTNSMFHQFSHYPQFMTPPMPSANAGEYAYLHAPPPLIVPPNPGFVQNAAPPIASQNVQDDGKRQQQQQPEDERTKRSKLSSSDDNS